MVRLYPDEATTGLCRHLDNIDLDGPRANAYVTVVIDIKKH